MLLDPHLTLKYVYWYILLPSKRIYKDPATHHERSMKQPLITRWSAYCPMVEPAAWVIIKGEKQGLVFVISSPTDPPWNWSLHRTASSWEDTRRWRIDERTVTRGKLFNMICSVLTLWLHVYISSVTTKVHKHYTPLFTWIFQLKNGATSKPHYSDAMVSKITCVSIVV